MTKPSLPPSTGSGSPQGEPREPEDLIREAHGTMDRAKERRPGTYELMRSRVTARFQIENDLRAGLRRDELRVHYQPVVDLHTGAVVSVEALVRWHHPKHGLLQPGHFIQIAEESGLIVPVGELVLREACQQAARWRSERPDGPVRLSVNVSPHQVARPGLVELVEQILEDTGLEPEALTLEITESVLIDDPESTVATLEALQALGVSLALDDFGSGVSSLDYFQRFPIEVVKIDRPFVSGPAGTEADANVVSAIVSMAEDLRLDVIAEGIETATQAAALRDLGCRLGQGYHYSPPLAAEDVERLLHLELPAARIPT